MGSSGVFRILTVVVGILIWLVGAGILGFSIYLRVDYWINQFAGADDELMTYTVSVYIFIATGILIIIFTIVGIYGAARPDKCALVVLVGAGILGFSIYLRVDYWINQFAGADDELMTYTYLIFLPLILAVLVGGGVYAYIYREEIENSIQNSNLLTELVRKKYGINARVTQSLDYMQRELGCCGGAGYDDYRTSIWANDYTPEIPDERKDQAPLTCCDNWQRYINTPYKYCRMTIDDPDTNGNLLAEQVNPHIFRQGCGIAFVEFMQDHISKAAIIAFSIVALLIFAIIFVILLLVTLKRRTSIPREDDVVYEMARTQEKSPYPARGGPYANLYQS